MFLILSLKAIALGIVEGLTEFIPVSSTGHLLIAEHFIKLNTSNTASFSISIQLGAILAVIFIYKDIFSPFLSPKKWFSKQAKTIIVATLPVLIIAFLFYSKIKSALNSKYNILIVAIGLIFGSILMILVEKVIKPKEKTKDINHLTFKQSLMIGLFQCLSLFPGFSRSGSTIIGGLWCKCNHQTAASFSFIIAVPVMLAAVSYDLLKIATQLTLLDLYLISIGFISSFIIGYLSIITFIKILKKLKLFPFALYRIFLASVIIGIFYFSPI